MSRSDAGSLQDDFFCPSLGGLFHSDIMIFHHALEDCLPPF